MRIIEIEVSSALSPSGLPDIDYALNPYLGCYHGCLYCYARLYTRDRYISDSWGEVVAVKKNLLSILQKEANSIKRGVVGIGTITDPYQPIESIYKLTRGSIELLAMKRFPISIQTKSSLILRDKDLLTKYRDLVDVGITITSVDNSMMFLEPRASPPWARINTVRKLYEAGIRVWIFFGPIVPGINDDANTIKEVVMIARETNSTLYYDPLHVKPFMWRNRYLADIAKEVRRYRWNELFVLIENFCKEYNVLCRPAFGGKEKDRSNMTLDTYR